MIVSAGLYAYWALTHMGFPYLVLCRLCRVGSPWRCTILYWFGCARVVLVGTLACLRLMLAFCFCALQLGHNSFEDCCPSARYTRVACVLYAAILFSC